MSRLKVVGDEWGCPTYVADVAEAIVELLGAGGPEGIHHVVNGLFATRADWARYIVGRAGLPIEVVDVPSTTWSRASTPPRWGVLEPTPLPGGEPLRPWPDAMADYAPILLRGRSPVRWLATGLCTRLAAVDPMSDEPAPGGAGAAAPSACPVSATAG